MKICKKIRRTWRKIMAYINGREIWFPINIGNVSVGQPQLYAPTIALSEDTLTITNNNSNGAFVTHFDVLADGVVKKTVSVGETVNLSTLGLSTGKHTITARACGNCFKASIDSNSVSYTVSGSAEAQDRTVTYHLTNATTNGTDIIPASMQNMEVSIKITAKAGYELPDSIEVTGCEYLWVKSSGYVYLSNFTDDVVITVVGVSNAKPIIYSGTYVAYGGSGDGQSDANALWLTLLKSVGVTLPCSIYFDESSKDGMGVDISCAEIYNSEYSAHTCYGMTFQSDGRITFDLEDGESVDAWNDPDDGLDVYIALSGEDFPNGISVDANAYRAFFALFEIA